VMAERMREKRILIKSDWSARGLELVLKPGHDGCRSLYIEAFHPYFAKLFKGVMQMQLLELASHASLPRVCADQLPV